MFSTLFPLLSTLVLIIFRKQNKHQRLAIKNLFKLMQLTSVYVNAVYITLANTSAGTIPKIQIAHNTENSDSFVAI